VFDGVGRALLRLKGWWLFGHWHVHLYGPFTAINPRNMRVGKDVAINPGVFLLARQRITIGDNVVLSARCMVIDAGLSLDPATPASNREHEGAPIAIEDSAWIGAGAIILPGVTVGKGAIVGAGSVVAKDVPAGAIVAGNPARPIGGKSGER